MPDDSTSNAHAADMLPRASQGCFCVQSFLPALAARSASRRMANRWTLCMRRITARANQGSKKKNGLRKYTQAMQGHLAAVAVGSARTELSANIRLLGRFFEQGVPADDDTCVRMMRALPSCGECGEIDLDISDVFKLELVALPAGAARVLDEDNGRDFPQCDVW